MKSPKTITIIVSMFLIPQYFACRYDPERWPSHLDRPPNLRLMDWLPLNDLLGRNSLPLLPFWVSVYGRLSNGLYRTVKYG